MTTLHITNGDCAAETLRLVVHDPVTIMADVLHEGPCPPIDGEAWHELRAGFLASYGTGGAAEVKLGLARGDRLVTNACEQGHDIVLWFEHDLFDQLALIRTLDLIVRLKLDTTYTRTPPVTNMRTSPATNRGTPAAPGVSLICIDRFPGIDRFIGLGQLTSGQLGTLAATGVTITAGHLALARDAWRAFRSPSPEELLEIALGLSAARTAVSEGGPALPFLGDALLRFLAEYPSSANGLSRTEELALHSLVGGERTAGELFGATQAGEAAPFLGDLPFFDILQRLASCHVPLVTVDRGPSGTDLRSHRVAITGAGRDVIARRADHVRLNGIDVWRGGVHLTGSNSSPWRWDGHSETLVS